MKLELKHLAPYLPYGLEYIATDDNNNMRKMDLSTDFGKFKKNIYKPILRPLADLTYEGIKPYVKECEDLDWLLDSNPTWNAWDFQKRNIETLPYISFEYLLKKHYDVFGLIEKGLAIDINTLKE